MKEAAVCVVVGATGGIGRALCARLASRGVRLVVGSRREEETRSLASDLGALGVPVDARDAKQVESLFKSVAEAFGGVDGVVNLAGSLLLKPAHLTSDDEWRDVIDTSLTTAFNVVRQSVRSFPKEGGSIVLVSTAAASIGLANHEAIAAAKAGVEGLARSAAASYGSRNIRINCVAPGLTRTPLTSRIVDNPAALKASEAMHALGRIAAADDVAAAIEFLLSQSSMTGSVVRVDGGLASVRAK
jgi:NAD(P)-dependent dehydrogenase (short-subunit alcohol dehydrogenase family)